MRAVILSGPREFLKVFLKRDAKTYQQKNASRKGYPLNILNYVFNWAKIYDKLIGMRNACPLHNSIQLQLQTFAQFLPFICIKLSKVYVQPLMYVSYSKFCSMSRRLPYLRVCLIAKTIKMKVKQTHIQFLKRFRSWHIKKNFAKCTCFWMFEQLNIFAFFVQSHVSIILQECEE